MNVLLAAHTHNSCEIDSSNQLNSFALCPFQFIQYTHFTMHAQPPKRFRDEKKTHVYRKKSTLIEIFAKEKRARVCVCTDCTVYTKIPKIKRKKIETFLCVV